MSKDLQRATHGPSVTEVLFGAVLCMILGVTCGAIWLVFKPVAVVKDDKSANEVDPNAVRYVAGETNNTTSRTWMRKRQLLTEGQTGEIVLTEAELNAWATASIKAPAANDTATVVPGALNFRIHQGLLQLSAPVTINLAGSHPVVFQTRGDFRQQGDVFVFRPEELYLGSLPAHRIPGLADALLAKLAESQPLPEDVAAAWKKVINAVIDQDHLKLTIK